MNLPEGWQLVPVEPTWEMLHDAWEILVDSAIDIDAVGTVDLREMWRNYLAAAPTPPAREDEPFCIDEGCPQAGIKHICISSTQESVPYAYAYERIDIPEEMLRSFDQSLHKERIEVASEKWIEIPLYTRPDDRLRNLAEKVCKRDQTTIEIMLAIVELRAALEEK